MARGKLWPGLVSRLSISTGLRSAFEVQMKRSIALVLLRIMNPGLLVVALSACGGTGSPSGPSPGTTAQLAGPWLFSETVTSVTGGECVGTANQQLVGTVSSDNVQITQSGSQLTAHFTSNSYDASCDYVGTAGST